MTQTELQKLQIGDRVSVKFYPYRELRYGKVDLIQWCTSGGKDVVYSVIVLMDGDTKPYGVHSDIIQLEKK